MRSQGLTRIQIENKLDPDSRLDETADAVFRVTIGAMLQQCLPLRPQGRKKEDEKFASPIVPRTHPASSGIAARSLRI